MGDKPFRESPILHPVTRQPDPMAIKNPFTGKPQTQKVSQKQWQKAGGFKNPKNPKKP